jgi:hypothetical protein
MNSYFQSVISAHKYSGVVVDTNLMLLYLIGKCEPGFISKYGRTDQFTIEDYEILSSILSTFSLKFTTPSIVTEICNLSEGITWKLRKRFFQTLSEELFFCDEKYFESKIFSANSGFEKFGLTDMGLLRLAQDNVLVLTIDSELFGYAQSSHINFINYRQLLESKN